MNIGPAIFAWLKRLTGREQFESDMQDELQFHIAARADELAQGGLPPAVALRQARVEFGAQERYKEEGRELSPYRHLDNLRADLRYAGRGLRRDPGFTILAVLIVAAMLTANTVLFAFLDAFFLRRLPIAGAERHFELTVLNQQGRSERQWPLADVETLISSRGGVLEMAYAFSARRVIIGGREPKRSYVEVVSANYFQLVRPPLAAGRTPARGATGAPAPEILLSYTGYKRLLGSATNPVGHTLIVDGVSLTVAGVLREGAGGLEPVTPDFWMLAGTADANASASPPRYSIGGILREGISSEQAAAALAPAVLDLYKNGSPDERYRAAIELRPTYLRERRELQPLALGLLLLFGLVTLIASANLTSLHLARATARRRDLTIRVALGASRARLAGHLVAESMLIAGIAAFAAWGLSVASLQALHGLVFRMVSDAGMSMQPIHADARIFVAVLLLAGLLGVGCGLGPALHSTRGALEGALRRDGLWLAGRVSAGRLRGALVVLQVALSLPLLVCAGILVRSAANANQADTGFDLDRIVDLRADPPADRLLARLRALPGVASVSTAASTPLTGPLPHYPSRVAGSAGRLGFNRVDERFFETLGMAVRQGRGFHAEEAWQHAPVAVISEATARQLFPTASATGQTIEFEVGREGEYQPYLIVGVVPDVMSGFFFQGRDTTSVYTPGNLERENQKEVLVRLDRGTGEDLDQLRHACADVGVFCEPMTLRKVLGQQRIPFLVGSQVASSLGLLALVLACLGLHGLARFAVVQRTREFGVRMALGASPGHILRNVLGESLRRSGVGLAVGLPLSLTLSLLLATQVPFLESFHAITYLAVPLILLACALLASLLPAIRAAAIDPVSAIRED